MEDKIIISLGSSCDAANQLKRLNINKIHYFFDFVWNELDGLSTVNKIIKTDFRGFGKIKYYTKTSNHPILKVKKKEFHINKNYPNFVFFHHDTSKIETIKSFNRKINRTREVLKSPKKKFFIYYRHYHWDLNLCTNLNILINESKNFCELYKKLYNDNFCLLSFIVYGKDEIKEEIDLLKENENEHLKFDFLYRRDNPKFEKRWDEVINSIFDK